MIRFIQLVIASHLIFWVKGFLGLFAISSPIIDGLTCKKTSFQLYALSSGKRRQGAMSRKRERKSQVSKSSGFQKKEPLKHDGDAIYSLPGLYDLAFGYRNFEFETSFLLKAHRTYSMSKEGATSIIELAAGPARHSMTALKIRSSTVKTVLAVDCSEDMLKYNKAMIENELGDELSRSFNYLLDDMRSFKLDGASFDSAWILLGSMAHLKTNEDILQCFHSVWNHLKPGGTFIIELPHPQELFSMVECTKNDWEVPIEDETGTESLLSIVWGDEDDTFNPISQIRDFSIKMCLTDPEGSILKEVNEVVPMRLFTVQEIDVLARSSGFRIEAMFGALDDELKVDAEEAFRLVCVMRKLDG